MATTEERIDKIETRFMTLEQQVSTVAAKVDMLVAESQQQREDIRRAQEKHDAEMLEERKQREAAQAKHDADMKEMNARFYAKFDAMDAKIDAKFDKLSEQIHTMTIAAVVGFGAIVVAVVGLAVAAFR